MRERWWLRIALVGIAVGGSIVSAKPVNPAQDPTQAPLKKPESVPKPTVKPPPPETKEAPVPKITGVSPSAMVFDGETNSVTIELTGNDFPEGSGLEVSFDSDPAEHLQILDGAAVRWLSPTLVRVTISAASSDELQKRLPADVAQKFRISGHIKPDAKAPKGTKDGKLVVSDVSSASFTPHLPLRARRLCRVHSPGRDMQMRLQVPSVPSDARVFVIQNDPGTGKPRDKVACSSVQVFGVDQLVCYLPEPTPLGDNTRVQVLRSAEHGAPAAYDESRLGDIWSIESGAECTDLRPAS